MCRLLCNLVCSSCFIQDIATVCLIIEVGVWHVYIVYFAHRNFDQNETWSEKLDIRIILREKLNEHKNIMISNTVSNQRENVLAEARFEGVSSNLASANTFSCWLKTVLEIMISLCSENLWWSTLKSRIFRICCVDVWYLNTWGRVTTISTDHRLYGSHYQSFKILPPKISDHCIE